MERSSSRFIASSTGDGLTGCLDGGPAAMHANDTKTQVHFMSFCPNVYRPHPPRNVPNSRISADSGKSSSIYNFSSRAFQRIQASERALRLASVPVGSSPTRMKPLEISFLAEARAITGQQKEPMHVNKLPDFVPGGACP